jgi:hypothetical protein
MIGIKTGETTADVKKKPEYEFGQWGCLRGCRPPAISAHHDKIRHRAQPDRGAAAVPDFRCREIANDWHLMHLDAYSRGGAGAIFVEAMRI